MPGNQYNPFQQFIQQSQQSQQRFHRHAQQFATQQMKLLQDQARARQYHQSAQILARQPQEASAHADNSTRFPDNQPSIETPGRRWAQPALIAIVLLTLGAGLALWVLIPGPPQHQPHQPRPQPAVIMPRSSRSTSPRPPAPSSPATFSAPETTASSTAGGTAVIVPKVVGQSLAAAQAMLSADGLMLRLAFMPVAPDSPDVGTVTDQNPPGGAEAHAGDVVTVTVGTAEQPTSSPSSTGAPSSAPPPPRGTPTATETAGTAPASMP